MKEEKKREIKIRNSAGILAVTIDRVIPTKDVFFGTGDDKLPSMNRPRLEIHKGTYYGNFLITLMDRDVAAEGKNTIYLVEVNDADDPIAYIGHFQPEKEDFDYKTCEAWRE